jgi:methionine sulfoxide reductase heme-binding subunit
VLALSGYRVPGFALGVDPVRFVLDTLGKTTINLLLITLCVSPVRQLTGLNNLIRLRRMLGLFTAFYALMHFLVYVGPFQGLSWHAIAQDIGERPYITIGFTCLLLLTPLALTSTDKMMRRLGRRWQKLHRLIYLIALLAVVHFWKMLKVPDPQVPYYAAIVVLLLGWRLWRRYGLRPRAAPKPAASSRSAAAAK